MRSRMTAATVGAVLVVLLTGCAPEAADPTPTPTSAFASEEEAFAAAEETYRAYEEALNAVDLSEPKTFEPVYALSTGEANASDRKTLTSFHAEEVTIEGDSVVVLLEPLEMTKDGDVLLAACVDVSAVRLADASGASIVDPSRPAVQKTTITLSQRTDSEHGFLVADIAAREEGPACS